MALDKTDSTVRYHSGDVIAGKYRLKALMAEGAIGGVWVAENQDLAAEVALKLIHTGFGDEIVHKRLLSEARVMARLSHPSIVRVFDYGQTLQGDPYIAMELLRGTSLGDMLSREGPMPAVRMARTILPVLEGLHYAHNQGVIHRDLKPDNLFIAHVDGAVTPKLLDFGIAKRRFEIEEFQLTHVNTVVGTPYYMSPEQAKGAKDLDARSDVFVMCALMYECLTGQPPFMGDDYNAIMWAIVDSEPKPLSDFGIQEDLLWAILQQGLQKSRDLRWRSARELGEALALWLREQGVEEDIGSRALRSSWLPPGRTTAQLPGVGYSSSRPPPRATDSSIPPSHGAASAVAAGDLTAGMQVDGASTVPPTTVPLDSADLEDEEIAALKRRFLLPSFVERSRLLTGAAIAAGVLLFILLVALTAKPPTPGTDSAVAKPPPVARTPVEVAPAVPAPPPTNVDRASLTETAEQAARGSAEKPQETPKEKKPRSTSSQRKAPSNAPKRPADPFDFGF